MRLGDDPGSPVLDLVQFIDPPPQGEPLATLNIKSSLPDYLKMGQDDPIYEEYFPR